MKQRLDAALLEAENMRKEADSLRTALKQERKALDELPYPQDNDFFSLPYEVSAFLPPDGEVLRMKIMGKINEYIFEKCLSSEEDTRKKKCTIFYVLMLKAQRQRKTRG